MNKKKATSPLRVFIALCAGAAFLWLVLAYPDAGRMLAYEQSMLSIASASISVEIPVTHEGFVKGLGGRTRLEDTAGMLFLCLPDEYPAFWMKDMRFPLDIIWIGEDLTVSGITHNVPPESFPDAITPARPAAHVLEVNAGFAEKYGISRGDMVFGLGGSSCQ